MRRKKWRGKNRVCKDFFEMKFQSVWRILSQTSSDQVLNGFIDFEKLWKIFMGRTALFWVCEMYVAQDQRNTMHIELGPCDA